MTPEMFDLYSLPQANPIKCVPVEIERPKGNQDDYKHVPIKPPVTRLDRVKAGDSIRRFVDLPKFLDLATTGELALTTLEMLCAIDPFECCARKKLPASSREDIIARITELISHTPKRFSSHGYPYDQADKLRKELEGFDAKRLQEAFVYVERKRMLEHVVCSCWHIGTTETDAMWKLYAGQLGVMLKSSVKRLETALTSCQVIKKYRDEVNFYIGKVQYRNTPANHSVPRPWLLKRRAFIHENEIRLFADLPFGHIGTMRVKVDLEKLVEEIVITPFAEGWHKRALSRGIEAVLKAANLKIPIRNSTHTLPPRVEWPTGEFGPLPRGLLALLED